MKKTIVILFTVYLISIIFLSHELDELDENILDLTKIANEIEKNIKNDPSTQNVKKIEKKIQVQEEEIQQTIDRLFEALYPTQTLSPNSNNIDLSLLSLQTQTALNNLLPNTSKQAKDFHNLIQFIPLPTYHKVLPSSELLPLPLHIKLQYSNYFPTSEEINDIYIEKFQLVKSLTLPRLSSSPTPPPLSSPSNSPRNFCEISPPPNMIFYNRIGKAGSSSLKSWITSFKSNFYISGSNLYDGESEHLTLEEEQLFAQQFHEFYLHKQNFFERHVHYINFTQYDVDQPHYINMMREPGDRYISQFYFWRTMAGNFGREMRATNLTVIDCIMRSNEGIYGCPAFNYQTLYFCGNSPICQSPVDEETFLLARKNLLYYYSVVGTMERFDDTTHLLEQSFPSYFPPRSQSQRNIHLLKNSYEKPPPEVYFMASIANNYDLMLYNLVNSLMDAQLAHCN